MLLNFTKMHGLGNDFVVIDAITQIVNLKPEQVRFIADRRFGVGCDQLLLVESPDQQQVDFKYRIFNADGSEVEQCGNGARCFARFVREKKLTSKRTIVVETYSGIITLMVDEQEMVTVDMGKPVFAPEQLPFVPSEGDSQADNRYTLRIESADLDKGEARTLEFSAASMGNPHITLNIDDIDHYPVQIVGKILESHPSFPNRVNVGFMQIINEHQIRLRVYERGSGETLACGTGACAAVANGIRRGWLAEQVEVQLPAGSLHIQWQQGEHSLMMTGPASFVYEGQITL
jgi:diaminopimelate epimerase